MKISIIHEDEEFRDELYHNLCEDIESLDYNLETTKERANSKERCKARKGDALTISSIIISSIGAGGALTLAVSKGGFLTTLASILSEIVRKQAKVKIILKDGTVLDISGPPRNVAKILRQLIPKGDIE